jgi:hypothetical protein
MLQLISAAVLLLISEVALLLISEAANSLHCVAGDMGACVYAIGACCTDFSGVGVLACVTLLACVLCLPLELVLAPVPRHLHRHP